MDFLLSLMQIDNYLSHKNPKPRNPQWNPGPSAGDDVRVTLTLLSVNNNFDMESCNSTKAPESIGYTPA